MTATATTSADDRPRGRAEIQAALIASTLELMESKGLEVSIRDIASAADLPHSLIGRYFGSKDGLVQAAIASTLPADIELAATVETRSQAIHAALASGFERPERLRILVQLLQAGMDPGEIRPEAPMMARLLALLEEEADPRTDPRIVTAAVIAATTGWVLVEEFVVHHAGLADEDRAWVRDQVGELLQGLVAPA